MSKGKSWNDADWIKVQSLINNNTLTLYDIALSVERTPGGIATKIRAESIMNGGEIAERFPEYKEYVVNQTAARHRRLQEQENAPAPDLLNKIEEPIIDGDAGVLVTKIFNQGYNQAMKDIHDIVCQKQKTAA